jgi:hypothetical protein
MLVRCSSAIRTAERFPSIGLASLFLALVGCSSGGAKSPGNGGSGGIADGGASGAGGSADAGPGGSAGEAGGLERDWAQWPMPNTLSDVDAGAPNPQTYVDNGDSTVTDTVTGLMWQQVMAAGTFTQPDAIKHCPTLTLAGHTDWRLPSLIELVSIVDYSRVRPSIYIPFSLATNFSWTSSSAAAPLATGWSVDFKLGNAQLETTSSLNGVRCVR